MGGGGGSTSVAVAVAAVGVAGLRGMRAVSLLVVVAFFDAMKDLCLVTVLSGVQAQVNVEGQLLLVSALGDLAAFVLFGEMEEAKVSSQLVVGDAAILVGSL